MDFSYIIHFGIISAALLLGAFLRSRIRFLQKYLIPSSIIGGFVLLFFYNYAAPHLNLNSDFLGDLVYHLLNVSFIAMMLRTPEEKKVIFSKYALPKVLKRIGMKENECILTPDGLDAVIDLHRDTSGIRDLEQAAEHIAANALYQIEVEHVDSVAFDAEMVRELLS